MSNFPGQPHSAGPVRAIQLQTPHEATLRANSAPGLELKLGPELEPGVRLLQSAGQAQATHRVPKPRRTSNNTANAFIIPTKDPWRRRRRRPGSGR